MNIDPMITFSDGSRLVVSTRYHHADRNFICELYLCAVGPSGSNGNTFRSVTNPMEGSTCRGAQEIACSQARRLFPDNAHKIKGPPYLVWAGPDLHVKAYSRGHP